MQNQHSRRQRKPFQFLLLSLMCILLVGCSPQTKITPTATIDPTATSSPVSAAIVSNQEIPSLEPTDTPDQSITPTAVPSEEKSSIGTVVLSKGDGLYDHLFVYDAESTAGFLRLTNDAWDDIDPALSPDRTKVAYASDRGGEWDIYIIDLVAGTTQQLTQTAQYDGSPAWSPDGAYIIYQTLNGTNLDLEIQSIADPSAAPIQLTDQLGDNYDAAWAPDGRNIAFITNRTGQSELWLADLQNIENRFTPLKTGSQVVYSSPSWSPDGKTLAWCEKDSESHIMTISPWETNPHVYEVGLGCDPVWSSDGTVIMAKLDQPNTNYLAAYRISQRNLYLTPVQMDTEIQSFDWASAGQDTYLANYANVLNLSAETTTLFTPTLSLPLSATGRKGIVELKDVTVKQPYLSDAADEAFNALRQGIGQKSGWDFLASLENAYLPLTEIPSPGITENWLYTGRAIDVNTVPIDAEWMAVTREDFSGQTYWRLWIKCLRQDGSCGIPMTTPAWDFSSRFDSDPEAYENGGKYSSIPEGYWIDFTELANRYGWQRVPSQADWRYYYPGILFNQFVYSEGLSWNEAMLDIYPPDAFASMVSGN